uniref:hypothetical protein n=1 Tax=Bernardetia sp. TaxID=1937974 RepID=UPI0025BE3003
VRAALFQIGAFGAFVVTRYKDDNKLDTQEKIEVAMRLFTLSDTALTIGQTWEQIKDLYPVEAQSLQNDFIDNFTAGDPDLDRKFKVSVNAALANAALVAEFTR